MNIDIKDVWAEVGQLYIKVQQLEKENQQLAAENTRFQNIFARKAEAAANNNPALALVSAKEPATTDEEELQEISR